MFRAWLWVRPIFTDLGETGLIDLIILLVVAGICGSIAQSIVGVNSRGCLTSIAVGFIGALLGTWMARKLALPEIFSISLGGNSFPVIWSIIGASLFVAVIHMLAKRSGDDSK